MKNNNYKLIIIKYVLKINYGKLDIAFELWFKFFKKLTNVTGLDKTDGTPRKDDQ